jgi:hypothetical protein
LTASGILKTSASKNIGMLIHADICLIYWIK